MPVTLRIPSYLAAFAGGKNTFLIEGSPATVSAALESLWKLQPGLRDRFARTSTSLWEKMPSVLPMGWQRTSLLMRRY
jgi:hypothetical protein